MKILLEVLLGIMGLSIVVLVHEAGHWALAKLLGIRVETFSVGYGRRLLGFQHKETDYRLSLFPLGGYCRFSGEEAFREALENRLNSIPASPGDFYHAAPWKRILVAIAGPLANLILAFLLFSLVASIPRQEAKLEPRIILASSQTDQIWPAQQAGLQDGDLILRAAGEEVDNFTELARIIAFRPEERVSLQILRQDRTLNLHVIPRLDPNSGTAKIGVAAWIYPLVDSTRPNSPALKAGFQPGDVIQSVNGIDIQHAAQISPLLRQTQTPVEIQVQTAQGAITQRRLETIPADGVLGLSFRLPVVDRPGSGFIGSFVEGFQETGTVLSTTLRGLKLLFAGSDATKAISGPARLIADTGASVAAGFRAGIREGFLWASSLISLISVSLAVLNLLPIPVLDGGQIVLFSTEILLRRPIRPKSVYRYQFIGTIIVVIIALAATAGDVIHFQGG